jgi:DNA gyrase inhibitor GyrI
VSTNSNVTDHATHQLKGEQVMSELDVRILTLKPLRAASFLGFGESPEDLAWKQMIPWAKSKGLLDDPENHRIFGFNNPDPSPGSPNYGYEAWIEIDPDFEVEDNVKTVDFEGGLYAVTRCPVPKGHFEVIGATWKKLVAWREDSPYKCGAHQWMEQSIPDAPPDMEFVLDLYLPIHE